MTLSDLEHLLRQLVMKYGWDRGTERALWGLIEEAYALGRAEMRAEMQAEEDDNG